MSYYYDYIQGLCSPDCEDWAIEQICEELDKRDQKIKELKAEIADLEKQLDGFTNPDA